MASNPCEHIFSGWAGIYTEIAPEVVIYPIKRECVVCGLEQEYTPEVDETQHEA